MGRLANDGVAAMRRASAARAAASRSSAPSPCASPHGANRSSRRRSRRRIRSTGGGGPAQDAIDDVVPEVVRDQGRARRRSRTRTVPSDGGAAMRMPAAWPISTTSTCRSSTAASVPAARIMRPAPVVAGPAKALQQLPQGLARRLAARPRRGRRAWSPDAPARAGRRAVDLRELLAEPPGQDTVRSRPAARRGRDERRQLGQQAALVAAGGIGGAGEDRIERGVVEQPGEGEDVGAVQGEAPDAPAGDRGDGHERRERPGRRGDDRQHRRSAVCARRRAGPTSRAASLRVSASSGSAARRRSTSSATSGSTPTPAGAAVDPSSRQRPSTPPDERGGSGRGPLVDGEERARFAGHASDGIGPHRRGRPPGAAPSLAPLHRHPPGAWNGASARSPIPPDRQIRVTATLTECRSPARRGCRPIVCDVYGGRPQPIATGRSLPAQRACRRRNAAHGTPRRTSRRPMATSAGRPSSPGPLGGHDAEGTRVDRCQVADTAFLTHPASLVRAGH